MAALLTKVVLGTALAASLSGCFGLIVGAGVAGAVSTVDRRTLGGRVAGTWRWDAFELVGGIDAQSGLFVDHLGGEHVGIGALLGGRGALVIDQGLELLVGGAA
jgi:hypothetical protein